MQNEISFVWTLSGAELTRPESRVRFRQQEANLAPPNARGEQSRAAHIGRGGIILLCRLSGSGFAQDVTPPRKLGRGGIRRIFLLFTRSK